MNDNLKAMLSAAREEGFDAYEMRVSTLVFRPEVRDMCAADKCSSYNKNWSCPPACGTLEEHAARCSAFSKGVLVQTVGRLEDDFDFETMTETGRLHTENFLRLTDRLRAVSVDFLALGMGACTICEKCTYPNSPCRFPTRMCPSMEACGLVVSEVCKENGVAYHHGSLTIAYTSCILFDRKELPE